ncbi:MAG: TIGR03752 family integrating conjugative element protein [Tatlockia sp.]|nr:TIGR03752 family integrating conjugative element protein [Tatlockia sp.]
MKANLGIKVLSGVVVAVVTAVLLNSGPSATKEPQTQDPNNVNAAVASQFNDNLRDVSARLIESEKKIRLSESNTKRMAEKIATLTISKEKGGVIIKQEASPELVASIETLKKELSQLKERREEAGTPSTNYPLGDVASNAKSLLSPIKDIDALLIKRKLSEQELAYWQALNKKIRPLVRKPSKKSTSLASLKDKEKGIPYYTIPAGADLGNTTLLSALIGEVPNDGKLMQPLFPFTAIINRGQLMASNGVALPPDISGMKVNGYAIGVGSFLDNISCVRAYVTSVLFTFQDGHFVVVGHEQMQGTADLVNNESLGYLTTAYGNPCIHGQYFTNAPRVLAAMMGAGGLEGVGSAISQWQMSYFAGPNGGAALPTGSFGKFAGGNALASGAAKASDWLEKRIQGSFDMVFVPASFKCQSGAGKGWCPTRMSLHLTQTISLDKQPEGRLLDYAHLQRYTHDFSLR